MPISRRLLSWLVAVGLLPLAAPDAGGQAVPLPGTGTRVRLMESSASGHRITGSVVGSEGDTVRLVGDAGDVLLIPASAFTRYEISRGVRSNLGQGLGFGALVGALGGVIVGLASAEENSWVCSTSCSAVAGGVVFGGLGAIVGSIIGASTHRERWVQANSGAPLGVGLSLRW
jgi:hypothetical protein